MLIQDTKVVSVVVVKFIHGFGWMDNAHYGNGAPAMFTS